MAVDDPAIRAARNAFLVLVVTLVGVSTAQFATLGLIRPETALLWVLAVATYFGSKWYYERNADASSDGT